MPRPPSTSLPPSPTSTLVEILYPRARGALGLRGNHAPLSWEHTQPPAEVDGDRHVFHIEVPDGEIVEFKVVRNEEEWSSGRNYAVHAGDHLVIEPYFDGSAATIDAGRVIDAPGEVGQLVVDVLLPPSYTEQETKRYPVLYALDGQALWTSSSDPYGIWHLDATLTHLYELGAIEELIVVGVHTSERRVERLSPVADPEHGGGEGPALLHALVEAVKPFVDRTYRTQAAREHTAVMGSSMGGLFAFFAAWSRPDVFSKAVCLSSSFWWANRWAVRWAQEKAPPSPRPSLYLDSGAAHNALERDANLRDGFHHTRAMFRALTTHSFTAGVDLHRLVFPGATHDAASWAARIALPLQLLFPFRSTERIPPRSQV